MSYYIVGYTVKNQNFGLRLWYMDSVFAITPNPTPESTDCRLNAFKNYKIAEKYYRRACVDFWKNLKPEFRGGRVWIRKVGSSKNPFAVEPITSKSDVLRLSFWSKKTKKTKKNK
jgi:hypothetical protein